MFYSQFILAKKGPLGTIWIAAHLERKLRKNQVADTDIGVSVDSILFPEVPIALRLSSHLLLGVVRIYSRKVNYLFDDCSEALLKIKQAFRSTAVDLPPEESTAPYHSITLPETFDLDDFELPDNEMFQGNYVDHHVSTREQITLQDTMEGVVYSTSQFGLDERFGDGDTSQIGLDLDEELFSDKVAVPEHNGVAMELEANTQASVQPTTPLKIDEINEGTTETSDAMLDDGSRNQMKGLVASSDLIECADAPSTPGLVAEPNLSNIQEALACDDNLVSEDHNSSGLAVEENLQNTLSDSDHHMGTKNEVSCSMQTGVNPDNVFSIPAENGYLLGPKEIIQMTSQGDSQGDLPYPLETMENMSSDDAVVSSLPSADLVEQVKPSSSASASLDKVDLQDVVLRNNINNVEQVKPSSLASASLDKADLQDVVLRNNINNVSTDPILIEGEEPHGIRLDETAVSSDFSCEASVLAATFCKPCLDSENISEKSGLDSVCLPGSGSLLENGQESFRPEVFDNVDITRNVEESCSPRKELALNAVCVLESPDTAELEKTIGQTCQEPMDSNSLTPVSHEEMPSASMHVLQPCSSHRNEADALYEGGECSVKVPDLPSEVNRLCLLETSDKELVHVSGASCEVQGDGSHVADLIIQVSEANTMSEPTLCEEIQADHMKFEGRPENGTLRDTQLANLDGSASSDFPALEKLLSVPEGLTDLPSNLLVVSTPDKEVQIGAEQDGASFNMLSGKKRSLTESESTLTLQSRSSDDFFGLHQSKRIAETIPDDNDLLSSILVGRKSSVLKIKPTPPPLEVAPMKRPRSVPRVGAYKRKVLVDDSMVLHGDAIRQQLTNTEDIRRVRKKAPCTRPEIWLIQKQLLEDEIFREPISTGMSMKLVFLQSQMYDLSGIRVSQSDENNAFVEPAKVMDVSVRLNVTEETEVDGTTGTSVVRHDKQSQPAETPVQTEVQHGKEHVDDTQEQMKVFTDGPELKTSQSEVLGEITEMEIDKVSVAASDAGDHAARDHASTLGVESLSSIVPSNGINSNMIPFAVQSSVLDETNGASMHMDLLCLSPCQKLDEQSIDKDNSIMDANGNVDDDNMAAFVVQSAVLDKTSGASMQMDLSCLSPAQKLDGQSVANDASIVDANDNLVRTEVTTRSELLWEKTECDQTETVELNNPPAVVDDLAKEEITKTEVGALIQDVVPDAELGCDDKDPTLGHSIKEDPKLNTYSVELDIDMKKACLNDGENPGCQEAEPQRIVDVENVESDHLAVEEHGDFENIMAGHDTEFLNVDDDDVAEDDDDYMPSAEEAHFLENSGWSSRTRAVAKYLQILFDKEAEHGKRVLPMDNLLTGKTRKEASRMFFETLVLKTRDYIHVEQDRPFDNINIKPKVKLMKADF
ncbi:sister chromatid cohesion 1 protein 4 isoform X2 [Malania oleifera]|uniref:sister chromatid cohesion 1 protein 4 isoform X2 n=1 Tax=Malania oleifera TaxID=397392 RepID=UPI0025AE9358|nr:sister chromatid cohesion 1 protein 4 isoform X2 [Malania oleifera]